MTEAKQKCTCTDLHGVEEEEHDEKGDGGPEGETHGLQRVQCGHTARLPPLVVLALPLLHGQGPEGAVHNQQDRDEEGGHARRVHDGVGQVKGLG